MRRYLPLQKSNSTVRRSSMVESEKDLMGSDSTTVQSSAASTIQETLVPPNLKVKKVDYYYSKWSRKWKYQNSGSNVIPEMRSMPSEGKDDPWGQFCFVVVRTLHQDEKLEPTFKVVIKSSYLRKACQDVMQEIAGLSWNSIQIEVLCYFDLLRFFY